MSKIPKVIFQTSKLFQYGYVSDMIKAKSEGWEYIHFNDFDILKYLEQNPLDEFPDIINVFHSFTNGAHKSDLFRYYYLYINGGVFLDNDAIIECNIDAIIKDYDFCSVNSVMDKKIFNGFIGVTPHNIIIYKALQQAYTTNNAKLTQDYFTFTFQLYHIIEDVKNTQNNNLNIKLFNERLSTYRDISYIYDENNKHVITHYFISKIVPFTAKNKNSRKIIGITIRVTSSDISGLFTCGLHQNAIYLYELLMNIGYEVYFIIPSNPYNDKDNFEKNPYLNKYKYIVECESPTFYNFPFDCIFVLSYVFSEKSIFHFKNNNIKIVLYSCGNDYFIISENILYTKGEPKQRYLTDNLTPYFNECWIIPQMVDTNLQLKNTLYRCKCKEVPFIWSPKLLEELEKIDNTSFKYVNRGPSKKISIFEPNLSIMKWSLPALLICENVYRLSPETIKHVYTCNIDTKTMNMPSFEHIINSLNLRQDKKISIEARYNTLYFMSKYSDIAVSHQMENNLNYLWLDLAWYGWPVVHNGSLCSDIGYYYEGFNYEMGGKVLLDAIHNHDSQLESYTEKNRQLLDRYLPTNIELHVKYKKLVDDLFVDRMFTKILYINLDRRTDRKDYIKQQLEKIKWTGNIERISAIDGKTLDLDSVSHLLTDAALLEAKTMYLNPPPGSYMSMGAVGCALSHREAYLNIQNGPDDYVLIIEDDVLFDDNFSNLIKTSINNVPDYDILYINHHNSSKTSKINGNYSIPTGAIFGTFAMVIHKRVIPKLLTLFPIDGQVDSQMRRIYKDIKVYCLNSRNLITSEDSDINNFDTDIQGSNIVDESIISLPKFVVNLKRREDRLNEFMTNCKLENVNVEYGFDGKNPDNENVEEQKIFNLNLEYTKNNKNLTYNGEIGCFISHIRIFEKIVKNNYKYAFIFEDDAIFCNNFKNKLINVMYSVPDNFDVLYIGGRFTENFIMESPYSIQINKYISQYNWEYVDEHIKNNSNDYNINIAKYERTTHSYVISNKFAKIILNEFYTILNNIMNKPIDNFIIHTLYKYNCNVYNSIPLLCHSPFISNSDIR